MIHMNVEIILTGWWWCLRLYIADFIEFDALTLEPALLLGATGRLPGFEVVVTTSDTTTRTTAGSICYDMTLLLLLMMPFVSFFLVIFQHL